MPPEELARAVNQRPFVPFKIHLTDGTVYEIRHPELVMVGRRGAALIGVTATDQGPPMFDCYETVAVLHVTRLEPLDAAAPASGNGQ